MVIRISGVPEGLQPGQFEVKFLRITGDIAMYEFVSPITEADETCTIQK